MDHLKPEIRIALEGKGGDGVLLLGQLLGTLLNTCYENVAIAPSYSAERLGGESCSKVTASKSQILNPLPENIDIGLLFSKASGNIISSLASHKTLVLKEMIAGDSVQIYIDYINKSDLCISIPKKNGFRTNICLYGLVSLLLKISFENAYSILEQFFAEAAGSKNLEALEYIYQHSKAVAL